MSDIDIAGILAEQEPLARSIAETKKVAYEISKDDMLFDFFVRAVFPTDHRKAIEAYFTGGEDCAIRFANLCREHLSPGPSSVLEFASGYGRVARYAMHVLPDAAWVCSDIHPNAIDFLSNKVGVRTHLSSTKPEDWTIEGEFDAVFALSFFSHMPDATFAPWLSRVFTAVKPGGILIFTTHGAVSLRNMRAGGLSAQFDDNGFYWNSNSDQRDLDARDYGTSAVSPDYVQKAVSDIEGAELIRFQQAFWWGHQDLYIVRKLNQ
ncbi:methyltransferase [Mesorhizobium sp. 131-3-5]|uniref:class I SAM-dependent methyltransferase n=1 Tax=Mesorhizobium sp. 131-3-5 TaxID=2744520 RepID=UPI001925D6AC|nr:class I SAM-dependent methyltransferase [Mesorhizobium sp. 131-3-5]BCH07963.1 methyltransferase [Mesorhizobium sp. 131-3-5]